LEFLAAEPYETRVLGNMQMIEFWGVGGEEHDGPRIMSNPNAMFLVNVTTLVSSYIWISGYIHDDEGIAEEKELEFHNMTNVVFKSNQYFWVKITPLADGFFYVEYGSYHLVEVTNTESWHISIWFIIICTITILVEFQTVHVIWELKPWNR
jgi:hypothetical protein